MKRPLLNLIGILTFGFILVPTVLGDCQCQAPEKGDGTRWGGNEMIVVVEERSFRQLRGEIRAPDNRPLEDALVEVFDGAEYLLAPVKRSQQKQTEELVSRGADAVDSIIAEGVEKSMTIFNRRAQGSKTEDE